jgi:peroxidase
MAASRGAVVSSRAGGAAAAAAFLLLLLVGVGSAQLQVGFYSDSCPDAEDTVTAAVQDAAGNDPTILPALLRLQFHDCFVKVYDRHDVCVFVQQVRRPIN